MPVLILRWASRPGYAAMFLALRREWPVTWRRYSLAKASSWGRRAVKTRIGASMPARRNSAPSWTVTTAREPAPASRAARETGTRPVKRFSETGSYNVQGEYIHPGYHPDEPPALNDGQYLLAPLGHDSRGLGEGCFGSCGHGLIRHHLAYGDSRALEGLPAVLIRIPKRHDAAEYVEEARRLYVRVLEDQVALRDYPDEPSVLDDRGPGDAFLGEQLDRLLHGALGS